ncbi:hypothetical protein AVEN_142189-1, partial [Araneus ventricosus]
MRQICRRVGDSKTSKSISGQWRREGFYCFILLGINIAVHCVMYTYYGLSSLGPHMAKYLWWKKYLTALQI